METWKPVANYEDLYEVSDKGNVRSKRSGKILKSNTTNSGYLKVTLCNNGNKKTATIHKLVAEAFIPNPNNKPCVDHIDTNRINNNVNNLRWCSQKENLNNPISRKNIKNSQGKTVAIATECIKKKVRCITTGMVFESAAEATRYYGIKNKTGVRSAANPKSNQKYAGTLADGTKLEWEFI